MTIYTESAHIGKRVLFQSKNTKDKVNWRGTLIGTGTLSLVQQYGNLAAYHEAVKKTDPELPSLQDCNFFIVILDDVPADGDSQKTRAFANEWIVPGSYEPIIEKVRVVVEVYDLPTNNHAQIITALHNQGYRGVITAIKE